MVEKVWKMMKKKDGGICEVIFFFFGGGKWPIFRNGIDG